MSVRDQFYNALRKILFLTVIIGLLLASGSAFIYWYAKMQLPAVEGFEEVALQIPLQVYSHDGLLIGEFGELRRLPRSIKSVPKLLIQAVLAAEDHRFYEHPGIDVTSLVRATLNLIKTGEIQQGGSTITMQVARNAFLGTREQTFTRKFKEILLAWQIEKKWSKDEIMELYLNKIFLGNRAYGMGAAAQVYYGKPLEKLTLAEMAMLAGLPKAPSFNNPLTNPERAKERRNYILKRMRELHSINQEDYQKAVNTPVEVNLNSSAIQLDAHYVAEMVRAFMVDKFGEETYSKGFRVITTIDSQLQRAANLAIRAALLRYDDSHGRRGSPLIGHVSLSSVSNENELLNSADKALTSYPNSYGGLLFPSVVLSVAENEVKAYQRDAKQFSLAGTDLRWARKSLLNSVKRGDVFLVRKVGKRWRLASFPQVEGALVALRPGDGSILTLVGGFDFFHSKFNRVTQAVRQPGSSFKPFIYSAALERGYTPASVINDAPFTEGGGREAWHPQNYSGRYYGPTSLRKALAFSRNLVSVHLLYNIGVPYAIKHLTQFGFIKEKIPKNLTIALGTGDVTPLEMARAYAVFANGGYLITPHYIEHIKDNKGDTLCTVNPPSVCYKDCPPTPTSQPETASDPVCRDPLAKPNSPPRFASLAIPRRNAWIMTSLLKDVINYGTAKEARKLNRTDLAGKTGTTNDFHDAWFVGYTPDIVTATWVGFDQPRSLGHNETGGKVALPMWIDFMTVALKDKEINNLPMPTDVTQVRIDPESGQRTNSENPHAKFETFYRETTPKKRKPRKVSPSVRPVEKLRPKQQSGGNSTPRQKPEPIIPKQLF